MPLTATTRLCSVIAGHERQRRRQRRRHHAVQQQTRPHADRTRRASRAETPRCCTRGDSVGRPPSAATSASARSKRDRCSRKVRRLRVVGGGEMRVHGVELEVRARQQLRQRSPQVVVPETQAVHARVDLEVIAQPLLVADGGGLDGARGAGRGNGRRQPAVEQSVEIADAERAEHQDLGLDAGGPQRRALFDVRARQQVRADRLRAPAPPAPRRVRRRSP